jgi:two-component system, NarL family, sensor histidine kinase UhpB
MHSKLTAELPRPLPLSLSGLTDALWHRRSIRGQLLIVFVLIEFIAAMAAGGVIVERARTATQVEVAASMELAELLVKEAVNLMQQEIPAERFLEDLASQLRIVRHVRIGVTYASGRSQVVRPVVRPVPAIDDDRTSLVARLWSSAFAPAPAWFAALAAPPVETRNVPVIANGLSLGSVQIISEPSDEIGEVWENTVALTGVMVAVNLCVIAILYVLFGRVLRPLRGLASGLGELELRRYQVRLPRPAPRELAVITGKFNALAEALEASRAENERLGMSLITAQDDERRRTALDLHDEVGPSLFALKANAEAVAATVDEVGRGAGGEFKERMLEQLSIIDHLQATNRSILNRLRPMALGHVPLDDLLSELVRDRQRAHPEIGFSFTSQCLDRNFGDLIDLTIYRCLQESLTNAIRHAKPAHVAVSIGESPHAQNSDDHSASELELTVRDDGLGIDPRRPKGHGTTGMQERVETLGGRYALESEKGRGTCVHIAIPVRAGGDADIRTHGIGGVA